MAIDPEVFAAWLEELASYYGRKVGSLIERAWYKQLGQRMTTEQFVASVEKALFSCEFMPTPEKLLELVKGNAQLIALEEWEKCLAAACRADREAISKLSAAGQIALRAIGGLHALGQADEKDNRWMQKKFVEVWLTVPDNQQRALPAANEPVVLPPQEIQALTDKLSMNGKGRHNYAS